MTANQIANASNMIQEDANEERARNNKAIENETQRHNLEMEDIQKMANELEKQKIDLQDRYNQDKLALDRWYNEQMLEWQKVQGTKKLEIEQQLAMIEEQKALMEKDYKLHMEMISDKEIELKDRAQTEIERVDEWNKSFKAQEISIKDWQTYLDAKRIEYQNTYWNASIALGNYQATLTQMHNQQQYDLGMLGLERDLAQLRLAENRLHFDQTVNDENQTRNWILGIGDLVFGGLGKTMGLWMYGLPNPNLNNLLKGVGK